MGKEGRELAREKKLQEGIKSKKKASRFKTKYVDDQIFMPDGLVDIYWDPRKTKLTDFTESQSRKTFLKRSINQSINRKAALAEHFHNRGIGRDVPKDHMGNLSSHVQNIKGSGIKPYYIKK